jgi:uncharacterized protein YndB with AHSA1/START domain
MFMDTLDITPVNLAATYAVPPELVFDAWVKHELMHKWLFIGPTSEIVNIETDFRPGGGFSIRELEKTSHEYIEHYGKYLEIDPPQKLVFTLSVPKHFSEETKVTVMIEPHAGGCTLQLTQTGVAKEITEGSWRNMLEQLRLTLENQ